MDLLRGCGLKPPATAVGLGFEGCVIGLGMTDVDGGGLIRVVGLSGVGAWVAHEVVVDSGDTISDDDDPDFNVDDEYESVEDDGSDEQHIPNSSDVDTDVEGEFDSLVVRNVTNLPVGGVPSG
ncbi:hypothetical protein RJT34_03261 [Clitoria ternatea]|uniref:Uncharacterized protein n=1 Tax=Clitoria ternatea TaxID=43366 RepID=A0AAN9Q4X1_CLITE